MRKIQKIGVIVGLLFSVAASAEYKQTPKVMSKIEPLPRDLEIQLALSALPPHLRDNATVYVLNPDKGFKDRERDPLWRSGGRGLRKTKGNGDDHRIPDRGAGIYSVERRPRVHFLAGHIVCRKLRDAGRSRWAVG